MPEERTREERAELVRQRLRMLRHIQIPSEYQERMRQFFASAAESERGFASFEKWAYANRQGAPPRPKPGFVARTISPGTRRDIEEFRRLSAESAAEVGRRRETAAETMARLGPEARKRYTQRRAKMQRLAMRIGPLVGLETVSGAIQAPFRWAGRQTGRIVPGEPGAEGRVARVTREAVEAVPGFVPYAIPAARVPLILDAIQRMARMTGEAAAETHARKPGPATEEIIQFARAGGPFTPAMHIGQLIAKKLGKPVLPETTPEQLFTGGDVVLGALMAYGAYRKFGAPKVQRWQVKRIQKAVKAGSSKAAASAMEKLTNRKFWPQRSKFLTKGADPKLAESRYQRAILNFRARQEAVLIRARYTPKALEQVAYFIREKGPTGDVFDPKHMIRQLSKLRKELAAGRVAKITPVAKAALKQPFPEMVAELARVQKAYKAGQLPGIDPGVPPQQLRVIQALSKRFAAIPREMQAAKFAWSGIPKTVGEARTIVSEGFNRWSYSDSQRRSALGKWLGDLVKIKPRSLPKYRRNALVHLVEDHFHKLKLRVRHREAWLQKTIGKAKIPQASSLNPGQIKVILDKLKVSPQALDRLARGEAALDVYGAEGWATRRASIPKKDQGQLAQRLVRGAREDLWWRQTKLYGATKAERAMLARAEAAGERIPGVLDDLWSIARRKEPSRLGEISRALSGKEPGVIRKYLMEPMIYGVPNVGGEMGKGMLEEARLLRIQLDKRMNVHLARGSNFDKALRRLPPQLRKSVWPEVARRWNQSPATVAKATSGKGAFGELVRTIHQELYGFRQRIPAGKRRFQYVPQESMKEMATNAVRWQEAAEREFGRMMAEMTATPGRAKPGPLEASLKSKRLQARKAFTGPMKLEHFYSNYVYPMERQLSMRPFMEMFKKNLQAAKGLAPSRQLYLTKWASDVLGRNMEFGRAHPGVQGIMDAVTVGIYSAELKMNVASTATNLTQSVNMLPGVGLDIFVKGVHKFTTDANTRKMARKLMREAGSGAEATRLALLKEIGQESPLWRKKYIKWFTEPYLFAYGETQVNRAMGTYLGYQWALSHGFQGKQALRIARIQTDLGHFLMGPGFKPELTRMKALRPAWAFTTFPANQMHWMWNMLMMRSLRGIKLIAQGQREAGMADLRPILETGGVVAAYYMLVKKARESGLNLVEIGDKEWASALPIEVPGTPLGPTAFEANYVFRLGSQAWRAAKGEPKARVRLIGRPGTGLRRPFEADISLLPARRAISKALRTQQEIISRKQRTMGGRLIRETGAAEAVVRGLTGFRTARERGERARFEKILKLKQKRRWKAENYRDDIRRAWNELRDARGTEAKQAAKRAFAESIKIAVMAGLPLRKGDIKQIILDAELEARWRAIRTAPRDIRRELLAVPRR